VPEWWNTNPMQFARPEQHLFELLGLGRSPAAGRYRYGKGVVQIVLAHPTSFGHSQGGARRLLDIVKRAWWAADIPGWREQNYIKLSRGPYVIAAVLDETTSRPLVIQEATVDLFDPKLRVAADRMLTPAPHP